MKKLSILFFVFCFSQAEHHKFVIDICSYNNAEWYEKNIRSVLDQKYPSSHFRIIYTDDKSPDGTGDLVENFLKANDHAHQVLLIKNKERRRALANHYHAIHLCDDDEIILTLDGDDWLAHENVLADLDKLYSENDIWFAYSRFENWPKKGSRAGGAEYSKPVPTSIIHQHAFRRYTWVCGQLRTFYAWLAKQIKLEDLLLFKPVQFEKTKKKFLGPIEKLSQNQIKRALVSTQPFVGTFFPSACDVALMIPMLEMAGQRFAYIDEPIYIRNLGTDINDHKVDPSMQLYCARYIREFEEYKSLEESQKTQAINTAIGYLTFFENEFSAKNDGKNRLEIGYDQAIDTTLLKSSLKALGEFIYVCDHKDELSGDDYMEKIIEGLKATHAFGFHFNAPPDRVPSDTIFPGGLSFWQYAFRQPTPGAAVYRTSSVLELLDSGRIKTGLDLWHYLPVSYARVRAIGLFDQAW